MTEETGGQNRAPGIALGEAAREEARRALLDLFAEAPVDQIAMRDAARRAGVGLATLYKYFGGKETMAHIVLAPELDGLVEAMGEASRREVGVKARLRAVMMANFAFARDHPSAARAVILNLPAAAWSEDEGVWRTRRRAVIAHIIKNGQHDGSVRDDLTSVHLADHVCGAIDQRLETMMRSGADLAPAEHCEQLFSLIWPAISSA